MDKAYYIAIYNPIWLSHHKMLAIFHNHDIQLLSIFLECHLNSIKVVVVCV